MFDEFAHIPTTIARPRTPYSQGRATPRRTSHNLPTLPSVIWEFAALGLRGADRRTLASVDKTTRAGVAANDAMVAMDAMPTLNSEQRAAFVNVALYHRGIYLSGAAGTGKTHTLKATIAFMQLEGVELHVCAPTACAAMLLKGTTIHKFANIRNVARAVDDEPYVYTYNDDNDDNNVDGYDTDNNNIRIDEAPTRVTGVRPTAFLNPHTRERMRRLQCLVLDEVSMCDVDMFELLDRSMRAVQQTGRRKRMPFGGVQLVTLGDFAQLPPVCSEPRIDGRLFAFQHATWSRLLVHRLVRVVRQSDSAFATVLDRIRDGACTNDDCKWLVEHSEQTRPSHTAEVAIMWKNKDATLHNNVFYDRIAAPEVCLVPRRSFTLRDNRRSIVRIYNSEGADVPPSISSRLRYPNVDDVFLKVGCRVRCTRNVYRGAFDNRELMLANGNFGVVTAVSVTSVNVRFDNTTMSIVMPMVYRMRTQSFKFEGHTVQTRVAHWPLKLAWAITTYAAQGATVPNAVDLDPLGKTKTSEKSPWRTAPGFAYTQLSRTTSISNVHFLRHPTPSMFVTDERVRAYHTLAFAHAPVDDT